MHHIDWHHILFINVQSGHFKRKCLYKTEIFQYIWCVYVHIIYFKLHCFKQCFQGMKPTVTQKMTHQHIQVYTLLTARMSLHTAAGSAVSRDSMLSCCIHRVCIHFSELWLMLLGGDRAGQGSGGVLDDLM